MKRIACLILTLLLVCSAMGQKGVEKMQRQKAEIERQIEASKRLLSTTDNDIRGQLATLNALTQRLNERRRLLEDTRREIRELDIQSHQLVNELKKLHEEYDECRDRYASACQFYQKQKSSFNPLLFVFSSNNMIKTISSRSVSDMFVSIRNPSLNLLMR